MYLQSDCIEDRCRQKDPKIEINLGNIPPPQPGKLNEPLYKINVKKTQGGDGVHKRLASMSNSAKKAEKNKESKQELKLPRN